MKSWTLAFIFAAAASLGNGAQAAQSTLSGAPVFIGLDAEFGHATSTSAEAIKRGMSIAIDEINAAGGVLKGRPLVLEVRDNRSVPTRAMENIKELSGKQDLVAVFTGKFSPAVLDSTKIAQELGMNLMATWSAADGIIDNGFKDSHIFRLSMRDAWALEAMLKHAQKKGTTKVGLLLPNTAWGRSSLAAAENFIANNSKVRSVSIGWYNWGDKSLMSQYQAARAAGAQTIMLVANEQEGSSLVKEVAALPKAEHLPIVSHWGVTGGDFVKLSGPALADVDFSVVQTYSFIGSSDPVANKVMSAMKRKYGVVNARAVDSPVGVAHAYDLVHILALAINKSGSTDRKAIRSALEQVRNYRGLVKNYVRPFTPDRHEALGAENVFLARFDADGAIVRLGK